MKTEDAIMENLVINYPLENLAPLEQILFLDIETTGFTARTSYLYLILLQGGPLAYPAVVCPELCGRAGDYKRVL